METPRMMTRSRHVPTPKMSDRKKSLFGAQSSGLVCNAEEDSDLGPMSPLKFSNSPKRGPMKGEFHHVCSFAQWVTLEI